MPRILYAAATELVTYAADRGVVVSEDDARIELNKAQDYIDQTYDFIGEPMQEDSEFPRSGTKYLEDAVRRVDAAARGRVLRRQTSYSAD